MKDSISFVNGLTNQGTLIESNKIVIIAIVVAVIAIASLVYYIRHKKTRQLKKVILEETANVDFTNMTRDWEKTKKLYDLLKKECHPDKFGEDLNKEATRIFQLVVENKYKYKELLSVKQEATEKLGIEL